MSFDAANPTSIVSVIRYARENARTSRPLISTEMWVQLDVFYNHLGVGGKAGPGAGDRHSRARNGGILAVLQRNCTGIAREIMAPRAALLVARLVLEANPQKTRDG
jgi:uncharacterized alpha-E superfamily protein